MLVIAIAGPRPRFTYPEHMPYMSVVPSTNTKFVVLVALFALTLCSSVVSAFAPLNIHVAGLSSRAFSTSTIMFAKAGVSSPQELKDFVAYAGPNLLVVDVRKVSA